MPTNILPADIVSADFCNAEFLKEIKKHQILGFSTEVAGADKVYQNLVDQFI